MEIFKIRTFVRTSYKFKKKKNRTELQKMLNATQSWAERHFATINADKSKFVAFMETAAQHQARIRQSPHCQ
jgi:hypothetical protein